MKLVAVVVAAMAITVTVLDQGGPWLIELANSYGV